MPGIPDDDVFARYPDLARYSRQIRLPQLGLDGQRRLQHTSVVLVGCGALGGTLASLLVRAGIGHLRLIDRDFVELDNLQRQMLFDEQDVSECLPKAEAAARKLRRVNSAVEVEPVVADLGPRNARALCADADLLLDGTDNLETRYLVNDLAVQGGVPWVYGACVGVEGRVLAVVPGQTPCLRCLWDEPPPPGSLPTCDTAGVLATAAGVVASFQATEALKLLAGRADALHGRLLAIDVWTGRVRAVSVQAAHEPGRCVCCGQGRYEFLDGTRTSAATALCGRDAVQVLPPEGAAVDLRALSRRLPASARAKGNEFLLRFQADACTVTLFADGRAIVQGTRDPAAARGIVAKYVGV